jgi:uncharacterized membrane protein
MNNLPCTKHPGRPARRILVSILLAATAIAGSAAAGTLYRIVPLPVPVGYADPMAFGINNADDVVGQLRSGNTADAVVWFAATGYTPHVLPKADATGAAAYSINDAGEIAGSLFNKPRAVIWRGDELIRLATPPRGHSEARSITADGAVLGWTYQATVGTWDVVWQPPSPPRPLFYERPEGPYAFVLFRAINDAGTLVGALNKTWNDTLHPFRLKAGGRVHFLAEFPLTNNAGLPASRVDYEVWDVNNAGQAVGEMRWPTGLTRALLWSAIGSVRDIGHLPGGGDYSYVAHYINNPGMVAGSYAFDTGYQSFVWTAAGGMRSIVDLIDPQDPLYPRVATGTPLLVQGINDNGAMIAVMGYWSDPDYFPVVLVPQAGMR